MAAASLPQYLFTQIVVSTISAGTISYNFSGGSESPATYSVGTLSAGGAVQPPFDFKVATLVSSEGELVAALANGGTVQLTQSLTVGQTLLLKSNTHLIIPRGITLAMANGVNHYLLRNAGSDGTYGNWSAGNTNIRISGGGTLNFNFANNTTTAGINTGTGAAYGGAGALSNWPGFGIHLFNVVGFTMEDLYLFGVDYTAIAGAKYCLAMTGVEDASIRRININNRSDGIHGLGGNKRHYVTDIIGTTGDDMVAYTPADYASYVIAGTRADCEDIHIANVTQLGDKSAVKLLGCSVGGTDYRIRGCSVRNAKAKPRLSTYPVAYLGGTDNCTVDTVFGHMSPDTAVIEFNHDGNISTDTTLAAGVASESRGTILRNITRRENSAFASGSAANREEYAGTKLGRILRASPQARVSSFTLDGFTALAGDGTEGYVGSGGVGTIELDVQTGGNAGYVTHAVIQNGRIEDANGGNGRFLSVNTGCGHDGSAYVGGVVVKNCYVAGTTYGVIVNGSATAARFHFEGNTFHNVARGIQCPGSQVVTWGRNVWTGTTARLTEITSSNTVAHFSPQVVTTASAQPYYSSGTPFTNALAAGSSYQQSGAYTTISGATTIGPFEGDVIVCTGTTYTVTLRDAAPGKVITIRNNASGTLTIASSSSGTVTGGSVSTGTTKQFVCTNYRDWTEF